MSLYLYEVWIYPTMATKRETHREYDMNSLTEARAVAYRLTPVGGYANIIGMDWEQARTSSTSIDGWGSVIKTKVDNTIKVYYVESSYTGPDVKRILYPNGRVGPIVPEKPATKKPTVKKTVKKTAPKKAAPRRK